jgi:DNA-binding NarL/FixJ family response regulator
MENKQRPYRVIIADDHQGVRLGIQEILHNAGDFEVVAQAGDGSQAVKLVKQKEPDLLILDVVLPELRGEKVARQITADDSDTKILALSSFDNRQYIAAMLENGASGYLTKDEAPKLIALAAREILEQEDEIWVSDELRVKTRLDFSSFRADQS